MLKLPAARLVSNLLLTLILITACVAPPPAPLPADTAIPSTATPLPATDTPVPPMDTPAPPTDTPLPPTNTPEPEGTPVSLSVGEILEQAQAAEEGLSSARVSLQQETIAPGGSIEMTCDGTVELPDRAFLSCEVAGVTIEMVIMGETEAFMRQAGEELWLKVPPAMLETPLDVTGLEQLGGDAQLVGEEAIKGVDSYVIESSLDLGEMFSSDPQMMQFFSLQDSRGTIKAWIGQEDFLPRRYAINMILAGPAVEAEINTTVDQDGFDRPVTIPEPTSYATQLTMATSDPVLQIAFSPDGQTLAASDDDAFIYLWSTSDPEINGRFIDHPELLKQQEEDGVSFLAADFYSLDFSPDSQVLAAGTLGEVLLYELANLEAEPASLALPSGVHVETVTYAPDGKALAAGGDDGLVYLWNLEEPEAAPVILEAHQGPIRDLLFLPDGETLVSASEDTTIRLWDLGDLEAEPQVLQGHDAPVYDLDVSADGEILFSVGFRDPVYGWSLATARSRPDPLIPAENPAIDKYPTLAIALAPDGQWLATAEVFGEVRLWAVPDFDQPYATFSTGNQYDIMTLDFSPDGRYLAAGQGSNMVHIWDLAPDTPAEPPPEAAMVNGLTAAEVLARNSEAMATLETVQVTMTVDDEDREPAVETDAEPTRVMTATANLTLPGDVHAWWEFPGQTWETLQLDDSPLVVRSDPEDEWELWPRSLDSRALVVHDMLALSIPATLARAPQFEARQTGEDAEAFQIAFAVRPREFFALEPMLVDIASATRTQISGKAWIGQEDLLTRRVVYEIVLKTPYVDRTVTYTLELDAFDEPVDMPKLEQ